MAIDFPASPINGQVYQGYYYDSSKSAWRSETPSVGAVVTSTTTPTGAKNGDLWYNTNDGTLYVYFDNGITAYWTEVKANSSLNTTLGNRLTSVETGKANLAGGNIFSGNQTFNSGIVTAPAQPVFAAMRRAGTLANATNAIIIFESTYVNIGNNYNTSNGRFTAPVAGTYRFDTKVQKRSGGALSMYWYKNGAQYERFAYSDLGGDSPGPGGFIYLTLAAGDYISVGYTHSGGGDIYAATEWFTVFTGHLVG